ncbi:MAG: A/G-specific adenine glycosylase [Treponema sp.]|jgi:A/G-specific adenine glycosylase|nr:A/G-specific adenine glycosylase [Treponema sp.]
MDIEEFRNLIRSNYEKEGRKFPWRDRADPWGILVSEFMLQQTQTERVLPYWTRWMKIWPRPQDLAKASLEEALREWSGLGYNRRCVFLKNCAAEIAGKHKGLVPETCGELDALPGIGPYTAGAIACFAYNQPVVFIETNIRAAVIHFFFPDRDAVRDCEIMSVLEKVLDRKNPRQWYYALMDYGAALKKVTVNPNRRSAHYAKQSRFEGSFRQLRGRVVKTLALDGPGKAEQIGLRTGIGPEELYRVLEVLEKESVVAEKGGVYKIRK